MTLGALLLIAAPLAAQIVRGRVVDLATGGALPGAHVVLVDTSGHDGASALTSDDGRFAIRAPDGGRYAIRVQRIGYSSTRSDPFELGAQETIEQQIAAPSVSVRLEAIAVNERSRCVSGNGGGGDVATVWEEVRKALSAATLTRNEQLVKYTLRHFERDLDPSGRGVKSERSWENSSFGKGAFASIKPEFLAEHGYAHKVDNDTYYFAPDADVLLSPGFLENHCMKLRTAKSDSADLVGLGFVPTRKEITEVEGALWVDRQTAELRRLEFRYTGLPVRSRGGAEFGGHVDYLRLPTGAWIVRDWMIRMPIVTIGPPQAPTQGYALSTPFDDRGSRAKLVAVHEEGGSVLESRSAKGTVLYTSPTAAPVPGPPSPR
jgi:carboxypeptidase family protein